MSINDLPDYPAIAQIRGALWRTGETQGAAVMVGAGFSRNADLAAANSRKPPLWTDFYDVMEKRLYPQGGAPVDPLKLAEEYKTAFGEPVLEGLIFDLVRDTEWLPGSLHHKLLSLPWVDVLTTNWDTLLERAAAVNIRQTYDIVRAVADIPRTKAPRIVKLHGSMPSSRPFIFTEEDYRTYPNIFAPFVNLVQQVLLENELCLIGFSGDDPNFLRWSGWVRDELGTAARRIHLVGVLNLSPTRRKYLEARNVSPIDLAPLVSSVEKASKHLVALQRFIDFLVSSKPRPAYDWPVRISKPHPEESAKPDTEARDPAADARRLKGLAKLWGEERTSYPGWLVCPPEKRQIVRHDTDLGSSTAFQTMLEHIDEAERDNVLYEIAWRFDIAFWPLPPWLRDIFGRVMNGRKLRGLDRQQRCHLGSILLRTAREERDKESFKRWSTFLQTEADDNPDILAAIRYEQCLWSRDHLDFANLASLVDRVRGDDPAWDLRRAALHWELGEHEAAATAIDDALREIRSRRTRDRKSLWLLSRLGWATFLGRVIKLHTPKSAKADDLFTDDDEERAAIFREAQCDPWDELYRLDRELDEAFRKKAKDAITMVPRFDAGTYIDRTATMRFVGWSVVSPAYEVQRLADFVALPGIAGHVNVMSTRLIRALELLDIEDEGGLLTFIRVLRSHTDDLMEKHFGRINVARVPLDTVERLIDRLWLSLEFGTQRFKQKHKDAQDRFDTYWIERVRLHTEFLSRLVVRLSDSKATEAFRRAVTFAKDSRWDHWWLFKPLGHLLERSITAVSPENRKDLLLDVLNFPLPDERAIIGKEDDWPELIESLHTASIVRPSDDAGFERRVTTLIEKVRSAAALSRGRAALRLTYLFEAGALNPDELKQFGESLWERQAEGAFPSDTRLLPHVFLYLPAPNPELPRRIFREQVLFPLMQKGITEDRLTALLQAARWHPDGSRNLGLTPDEAVSILDVMLAWRPKEVDFDLGEIRRTNDAIKRAIGHVLADAVFPLLNETSVGAQQIDKLFKLIEDNIVPAAVTALPEISRLDPSRLTQIVQSIRRALLSSDSDTEVSAFNAIYRWRKRARDGILQACPMELTQEVVAIAVTRREPGLLYSLSRVTDLVADGVVSANDQSRLIDALDALYTETAYEHWRVEDTRTTTVTLLRARCVSLAYKLKAAGVAHPALTKWIENASNDPIPEVRYALTEAE